MRKSFPPLFYSELSIIRQAVVPRMRSVARLRVRSCGRVTPGSCPADQMSKSDQIWAHIAAFSRYVSPLVITRTFTRCICVLARML